MKVGDIVKIGEYEKYFRVNRNSDLTFSTYSGLEGEVLEIESPYVRLYVPSKYTLYHKTPQTRVPEIQCEPTRWNRDEFREHMRLNREKFIEFPFDRIHNRLKRPLEDRLGAVRHFMRNMSNSNVSPKCVQVRAQVWYDINDFIYFKIVNPVREQIVRLVE